MVPAMIENPHGKDGVEDPEILWHGLKAEGKNIHGLRTCQLLKKAKLHPEKRRRVHTENLNCTLSSHSPAMISAAAAHIERKTVSQWLYVRFQALPFPVRAPLGVNVSAEDGKRPFSPGFEFMEILKELSPRHRIQL
jgi:hypothetical protein